MENQHLKTSPKDVFMHLLSFGVLYASVITFITLLFQYINVLFPDQLDFYYQEVLNSIRVASAGLLVLYPVFITTAYLLMKDFKKEPERKKIKFRKWLIYFTLFLASITVIIDLIMLINNFYSGELTSRFMLKVLAVLVTVAGVFWYYFWDLKIEVKEYGNRPKLLAWSTGVAVLVVLVLGVFIVGSPAEQRKYRYDDQRVMDLQTIQNEILYNYWTPKGRLPENLDELNSSLTGFVTLKDPKTNQPYEYSKTGDLTFDLCANFETELSFNQNNARKNRLMPSEAYLSGDNRMENWSHGRGRVCYSRTIDPELYKPKSENSL